MLIRNDLSSPTAFLDRFLWFFLLACEGVCCGGLAVTNRPRPGWFAPLFPWDAPACAGRVS